MIDRSTGCSRAVVNPRDRLSSMSWSTSSPGMAISRVPPGAKVIGESASEESPRKRVVVVGLGMVGIAFVCVAHWLALTVVRVTG